MLSLEIYIKTPHPAHEERLSIVPLLFSLANLNFWLAHFGKGEKGSKLTEYLLQPRKPRAGGKEGRRDRLSWEKTR